ncbi:MAG: site-2 protease family protein [Candidatus Taylorbacteria bacterium]|nr:site-2 protease family protein [Candidatus Taylorbacteria bacterium]
MITAIIFIIVLAVLILVHEFGHFIIAKKSGIRVDEFGLGFPPKIVGKKFGETEYTLNWIPFGGFVKIFGETPDDEAEKGADSSRSLINKNRWIQAAVLVGGVLFNFLFAWLLISISFFSGVNASSEDYAKYSDKFTDTGVILASVVAGTPAADAGLKLDDIIKDVRFATESTSTKALSDGPLNSKKIMAMTVKGQPLLFTVVRAGQSTTTLVTPKKGIIENDSGKYAVGILMADYGRLSLPLHLAIYEGGMSTVHYIKLVALGLVEFIGQAIVGKANYSAVSGPVGIAGYVGDAARAGFSNLLMFTAIISINLGVINFFPIPALDGGRLLFVLIEGISRKKIPFKVANTLNTVFFVLLLLLMAVVTYKDILKLF